jgi:uncharacterized membrane protein YhaH (DUF805 family)/uncharacterized RDD family membrane protein YckC
VSQDQNDRGYNKGEGMNWYLEVLKKYAVFSGRARRKEYWYFILFSVIMIIPITVIDYVTGTFNAKVGMGLLGAIYMLAVWIPNIAVSVRRLHDTDRSGWWLLIILVPLIGFIVLLVFTVKDSDPRENRFGSNPKETKVISGAGKESAEFLRYKGGDKWVIGAAKSEGLDVANWLTRCLAFLIDSVVMFLLICVGMIPTVVLTKLVLKDAAILWLLIPLFYGWFCERSIWQATIGKKIVGLIVRSSDGGSVSSKQAFNRNLAKFCLYFIVIVLIGFVQFAIHEDQYVFLYISLIMLVFIAWTFGPGLFIEKQLTIHDLFSKTIVIHKRQKETSKKDKDAYMERIRCEAEERAAEEAQRRAVYPIPKETPLNPTTVRQDKAELEKSVDRYVSELQGRGIVNVQNVAPSGSLPNAGVKSVDKSLPSDEAFYETAINEFESTDRKVGLWAKVFAEAQGNESLAKAHYLKIRAEQLANEYKQAPLAEERQRQEKEKTAAMESTRISDSPSVDQSLSVSGAKETGRDGRFIAYDNGTVVDTITDLMWAVKDNGNEINWANAKSYCENYRGGGYADWRMPTQDELAGLYDACKNYKSDCGYDVHLTELIRLTSTALWTSETLGSDAANFNFYYGERYLHPQSLGTLSRALPVRSGK